MLVGNGLSVAFSDQLALGSISEEMIDRFTSQYPGSDAVAQAMQSVAKHQLTGDPASDFEILIGAFGGQSDILDDLATFADLTKNGDADMANAILKVRSFVSEVQRRGIGHTLEIIMERTYSDWGRREPLINLLDTVLSRFDKHVTIANLNYDTLMLSAIMTVTEKYPRILNDMADGRRNALKVSFSGGTQKYPTWVLRTSPEQFMSLDERRLRLLHLHGSLTFWRFDDQAVKLNVDTVRYNPIWQAYRDEDTFNGEPLVVLANQHDKAQHILRPPFSVAYDVAEIDLINADHWLIVGYSFRDDCVNDLLARCWKERDHKPAILVSSFGSDLKLQTVEDAFEWPRGSAAANGLIINRDGAFELTKSTDWDAFATP
ncbi:SIR2 family protein [Gordonia sp. IITR100]|nr:SIR2 family protein [Gordonia sp. IITR100]